MYYHPRDGGFLIVNVTESQSSAIRLEMFLRFILIFTQASYVYRLCLAILFAHRASSDDNGGREKLPGLSSKNNPLSLTKVDMSLALRCEVRVCNVTVK